jgi:hypothetical protein
MKFEYLREFEPEFEKVVGYELGAHMGSIHEKNQRPKISCHCTFKCRENVVLQSLEISTILWYSLSEWGKGKEIKSRRDEM